MERLTERLMEMKQEIDKSKEKLSELKGKKQSLEEILKNKYGLDNIADAEKYLEKTEKELNTLIEQIREGVKTLEAKYNV